MNDLICPEFIPIYKLKECLDKEYTNSEGRRAGSVKVTIDKGRELASDILELFDRIKCLF